MSTENYFIKMALRPEGDLLLEREAGVDQKEGVLSSLGHRKRYERSHEAPIVQFRGVLRDSVDQALACLATHQDPANRALRLLHPERDVAVPEETVRTVSELLRLAYTFSLLVSAANDSARDDALDRFVALDDTNAFEDRYIRLAGTLPGVTATLGEVVHCFTECAGEIVADAVPGVVE